MNRLVLVQRGYEQTGVGSAWLSMNRLVMVIVVIYEQTGVGSAWLSMNRLVLVQRGYL